MYIDEERTESQGGEETEEESGKVSDESSAEESSQEEEDDFDKDRALQTIRAQREAEKRLKLELRQAKADQEELKKTRRELEKLTKGEQSRIEKLEGDLEEKTQALQERDDKLSRMSAQVRKANFVEAVGLPNPRVAYGLVASGEAGIEVEYDDNDRPANLKEVRKALREQFGEQFGDGSADGGKRGKETQGVDINAAIRAAAGR